MLILVHITGVQHLAIFHCQTEVARSVAVDSSIEPGPNETLLQARQIEFSMQRSGLILWSLPHDDQPVLPRFDGSY
jgi:hypothetical protein